MSKDNVVIEWNGLKCEFLKEDSDGSRKESCSHCFFKCDCMEDASALCDAAEELVGEYAHCISATKIQPESQPEPKMYFAWNREDARHLINEKVEFHSGRIEDVWTVGTLLSIRNLAGDSFQIRFGAGLYSDHAIIREIQTVKMTRSELNEKYGVPENVEIVEEGENE